MKTKHAPIIDAKIGKPCFIKSANFSYENNNPSLIKILNCGIESYDTYYQVTRNYGRSFVLVYIKKGQVNLERYGTKTILKAGDLAFISFKEYSRLYMDRKAYWSNYFLCLYGPIVDGFYQRLKEENATLIHDFNPDSMLRIIQKAIEYQDCQNFPAYEISELLYSLILEIDKSTKEDSNNLKICKILKYIDQHYQREIKLDELAEISGFSKYYICRLFKREKGKSFNTFINDFRMEKAKELLVTTNLNNAEIAMQTGFGDPRNLYYYFKKRNKMTPQEYRSSHQYKF